MGLVVLFLPWAFLVVACATLPRQRPDAPGSRPRPIALAALALAALEVVAVVAAFIDRHGRQFSEGLAPAWPFRIYLASGGLLIGALLASIYSIARRNQTRGVITFSVCTALLPFWFIFRGLVYSG